ncbi:MAG TPA: response regulator [Holophagaceae bacterium]|jgi:CheY-like chemotaxis protein|nr:response regulator [Holophagaceae bacterium]
MSGQRLLIVDNDRAFLKEHQAGLEAAFEVEVVTAPDTAIQRLESGAFACTLISVEIADNRGYALCASIRRSAKLSTLKVALISAKATDDEYKRHQSLKGRADLYLMKPIPPVNLVEALRPLVPPRGVDPDNPLGDLADDGDLSGDLGGDWLGDLKSDLDQELSMPSSPSTTAAPHAAGTVAISAAEIQAALASVPMPAAPSKAPAASHVTAPPGTKPDLAAGQVAHLKEELAAKDQRLQETEEALVQLQRQLNSVTVNLDELERGKKESSDLQAKLAAAQTALLKAEESGDAEALRQQLREAITERQQLIQQADTLNQQLSEKTTRTIDLLRERDKLQSQAIEAPALQARAESAEAEAAQLNASLEQMSAKHLTLETAQSKVQEELAQHRDRAAQLKDEVTGLEATVRGQGRQLAQMQDALSDAETRLKAAEEKAAKATEALKTAEETNAGLAKDIETAMRDARELRKELDASKARHDQERMELMSGLDSKEAELGRHKEQLAASQETASSLEKEKQGLSGQLADHGDRLKALASLMEELSEKLRQGSGLAKG